MTINTKFNDIYSCIVEYENLEEKNLKKIYIDERPDGKKICRFCCKEEPEVTFKKVAHGISENIGNKRLILNEECDSCNSLFGETFEDSFGKYILPFKIVSQKFGKSNKLKHKTEEGSFVEVRKSSSPLPELSESLRGLIMDTRDNKVLTMDESEKGFSLKIKRQNYNSFYVYKALEKMAFSIMRMEDRIRCVKSVVSLSVFVDDKVPVSEKEAILKNSLNIGFLEFIPGINPFNTIGCKLFKKKTDYQNRNYVDYFFEVYFGNFSLQIPIPPDEQRNGENILSSPHVNNDNSNIQKLDFTNTEQIFTCDFCADKIELSKQECIQLEEILRNKGILKQKEDENE